MINYSKYKRFYSTGEFLLEGNSYTGYVEVFDGIPCEDVTRKILTPKTTFSTEARLSDFFLDRLIGDTISLPNTDSEIMFQPNDYLNTALLSERLNKLHVNNLFLYTRLFITDNNIPNPRNVVYLAPQSSNDTQLTLFSNFNSSSPFKQSANFEQIGDIKKFVVQPVRDKPNHYALFGVSDTQFVTLTTNKVTTEIIEVTETATKYETSNNQLEFKLLSDIAINDTHVFVTDTDNSVVLKYEVEGYYNNDLALANRRNFIEVIGGEGAKDDFTRFKQPSVITCNNDNVVIYDSKTGSVKVFDTDFNYVTHLKGIAYTREKVVNMKFNNLTTLLYCLTQSEEVLRLYIYDSEFNLQESVILEETLEVEEHVNNIAFSYNDSNLWYLCTNYYVYKKLVNRPAKIVGRFQTENIFSNIRNVQILDDGEPVNNIWNFTDINWQDANFNWNGLDTLLSSSGLGGFEDGITIDRFKGLYNIPSSGDFDELILLSDCRLYFIEEQSSYRSVLKFDNFENYGVSSFSTVGEEFIQSSTINKELYKVIHDLFLLKNNIVGRFSGYYDNEVPILTKSGYNYNVNFLNITEQEFIDDFLTKYDFSSISVGTNEKSILGVLNRVLSQIYKLQNTIFEITQTDFETDIIPVFNTEGTLIIE
jgi:hypothetical protein